MKKAISVLLVLTFIFALTSCAPAREKAADALGSAITAIREQNSADIEKYFGSDISDGTLDEAGAFGGDGVMALLVKNLSYEVLESKEDGDTATVKVSVTNADMGKVMAEYISELFGIAMKYAFLPEEEQPTDEEMEKIYTETLDKIMQGDIPVVTNTVEVSLAYADGGWRIGESKEFVDALFGGLVSYTENLQSAFNS